MKMFETGRNMGIQDMDPEDAYDLGCKEGYRKGYRDAMREASEEIGFRENNRFMGENSSGRGHMGFRDDEDYRRSHREGYSEGMGERRERDSYGRYR